MTSLNEMKILILNVKRDYILKPSSIQNLEFKIQNKNDY